VAKTLPPSFPFVTYHLFCVEKGSEKETKKKKSVN